MSRDGRALSILCRILGGIAETRRLSLRTMEHIVRNVLVLAAASVSNYGDTPRSCAVVAAARVVEPGLFRKLVVVRPCVLEEGERDLLTEMLDPVGQDREEAQAYIDRSMSTYGELPGLARILDGFGN